MRHIDEVMTREQREQFANRVEVLEKVKALLMVPQLCMATTEQVANYFDVPAKTIMTVFQRNRDELIANGATIMTPAEISGMKIQNESSIGSRGCMLYSIGDSVFSVNYKGSRFYPPRAILCMAMLLRDSKVAEEIRTQLLNLVEAAPVDLKVANVQAQEDAMLGFARAMMNGDPAAIAQSVHEMIALKDHTIAAQSASIRQLSDEKADLETRNHDLTDQNTSLSMSNRMLAESAVTWEPRRVTNAIVRKIGKAIYNGRFSLAWNELYRELMYQTGISVGQRGGEKKNDSALSTIKDEEWPQVMKVLASLAYHYCIDVVDVTNEKVVEAYQLDRIETPQGIKYNEGICRTTHITPGAVTKAPTLRFAQ